VAQEHVEAEGEEAEEQGRGRPEVDAEGVQVLAHLPASPHTCSATLPKERQKVAPESGLFGETHKGLVVPGFACTIRWRFLSRSRSTNTDCPMSIRHLES
jgi:hypothetical protein